MISMSEVKHTPGPWALDDTGWIARVDNGEPVCLINAGLRNDELPSQELADAHLIAAAPEMLEALKACRSSIGGYAISSPDQALEVVSDFLEEIRRVDGIARAAIAKAEGRP